MEQTGDQEPSPIPGKMMNCGQFATHEPAGSSESASMCHGGRYREDTYLPCPVRLECRQATINRRYQLPQVQQQKPLITPSAKPAEPPAINPFLMPPFRIDGLGSMPTQNPQARPAPEQPLEATLRSKVEAAYRALEGQFPKATMPAENAPRGMRTPYAAAMPTNGEVSPTFLPGEHEGIFDRLMKNIFQGILAVIGWHIWNFARSVDLFG